MHKKGGGKSHRQSVRNKQHKGFSVCYVNLYVRCTGRFANLNHVCLVFCYSFDAWERKKVARELEYAATI